MRTKKLLGGASVRQAAAQGTVDALTPAKIRKAFKPYWFEVDQYDLSPEGVLTVKFHPFGKAEDQALDLWYPDIIAEIGKTLGADRFHSVRRDPYSATFVFDEDSIVWSSTGMPVQVRTGSFESEYLKQVLQELEQHVQRQAFSGIYAHGTPSGGGKKNWEVFVPKNQFFPKGLYIHVGQAENALEARGQALELVLRRYDAQDLEFIADGQVS